VTLPLPAPEPLHEAGLVATLRAAGCVFAEEEAAVLLGTTTEPVELAALVARRVAGEPLEQVVGWAEFGGVRVPVAPGVFVPRRRTRLLVDLGLAAVPAPRAVVDLCCGTGALAAAVAAAVPGPLDLHAADLDPAAVRCAARTLAPLGGHAHRGDLYGALPGRLRGGVDLLLVNAPYVPTAAIGLMPPEAREHEPRMALDGGDDGLDLHRRVAAGAPDWLAPGGVLVLETSAEQAEGTAAAVRAAGLAAVVHAAPELGATAVVGRAPAVTGSDDMHRRGSGTAPGGGMRRSAGPRSLDAE
jgi:release factor glutamine methyltransferase